MSPPPFALACSRTVGARCWMGGLPHLGIPAARSILSDLVNSARDRRGTSSVPSAPLRPRPANRGDGLADRPPQPEPLGPPPKAKPFNDIASPLTGAQPIGQLEASTGRFRQGRGNDVLTASLARPSLGRTTCRRGRRRTRRRNAHRERGVYHLRVRRRSERRLSDFPDNYPVPGAPKKFCCRLSWSPIR